MPHEGRVLQAISGAAQLVAGHAHAPCDLSHVRVGRVETPATRRPAGTRTAGASAPQPGSP
eukprot:6603199-Alexandrium_andersonii.AAC.1